MTTFSEIAAAVARTAHDVFGESATLFSAAGEIRTRPVLQRDFGGLGSGEGSMTQAAYFVSLLVADVGHVRQGDRIVFDHDGSQWILEEPRPTSDQYQSEWQIRKT